MCVICRTNAGSNEIDESTTKIDCSNCHLLTSKELNQSLGKCKALEWLNISCCPKIASLEGLGNCKELKLLYCVRCPLLTSLNLKNCRSLKGIWCYSCPKLASIKGLENLKSFEGINCSYCPLLTSLGIPEKNLLWSWSSGCHWLEYINKYNKNPKYKSNIKKLKILQNSCRKCLFKKRLNKAYIFKNLN